MPQLQKHKRGIREGGEDTEEGGNGRETRGTGGARRDKHNGSPWQCKLDRGRRGRRGGGLPTNIYPNRTTLGTRQVSGDEDRSTETKANLPRRTRDVAAARLLATKGGNPTRTSHRVVNNDTRLVGWRGGRAPRGGNAQGEEGRRASAEVAPDAPGEAGRPEQQGGGGGTPTAPTQQGFVHVGGAAAPSTEEGAELQGFTPARVFIAGCL